MSPEANRSLKQLRIIWGGMIASVVSICMIAVFFILQSGHSPSATMTDQVIAWSVGLLAVLIVGSGIVLFIRMQIYKKHWQGMRVEPQGYVTGNLVVFGFYEVLTMLSLVSIIMNGPAVPLIAIGAMSIGFLFLNFPNGKPMDPTPPELSL